MQCPYCQNPLRADAAECPACNLTFPRTNALLGVIPRLQLVVSDSTGTLRKRDYSLLKRRIAKIQQRFPQLVLQIVIHEFSETHPFSLNVFWIFNAGFFSGNANRGKDNHTLLLVIDPTHGQSALMPGYGLEHYLRSEALEHLLELAGPAWASGQWMHGIERVLDGIDQLMEAVATPITVSTTGTADF